MQQRPLLINGFMATGKTTLAERIAERTGRPYVDLDAELVSQTGLTIPEFFAQHGEARFRELEQQTLTRLLDSTEFRAPPVCALGGGALVHRPTRLTALRKAVVITLDASLDSIMARAENEGKRPLLATQDPRATAAKLLADRALSYREANLVLDTDSLSAPELAERAIACWNRDALAVAAGERSYSVEVGAGRIETCLPGLVEGASGRLLVSDRTVFDLYQASALGPLGARGLSCPSVVLDPGEQQKQLASIERVYRAALEAEIDRQGMFVALGGGVVTDMTGFAAATWLRGVRWVGVASTLLAMVDASVGGKTGVDFGPAKNSVGAFWQPSGVICDPRLVETETERAYIGALAEVVKTALIGDPELFLLLERETEAVRQRQPDVVSEMVRRSVALKAWVVATDERESGIRAWLNLGHTLGHALEAHGNYERLTHGEAVSLGLIGALRIGERLGHTPRDLVERTRELVKRLGLPHDLSEQPLSEAAELIGLDKKRAGSKLKFVVARNVGEVGIEPLDLVELKTRVRELGTATD